MAAFANDTLPDGWLACDGTTVSRITYANLFSKIGTTYGAGDGSTTFNLPNLTDRFIQGNNTAGTVKSAGLPNITGSTYFDVIGVGRSIRLQDNTGVFENKGSQTAHHCTQASTSATFDGGMSFDASRCNSIYGNSTTVQPPALTMRFAIFAGHSALHRWIRTV